MKGLNKHPMRDLIARLMIRHNALELFTSPESDHNVTVLTLITAMGRVTYMLIDHGNRQSAYCR